MPEQTRVAFLDCFSGISGNMLLGALIDAGVDPDQLRADLACLPLAGYQLQAEKGPRDGFVGTHVVVLRDDPAPVHRRLREVEDIIGAARLPPRVEARALEVFRHLARAEAQVHGVEVDRVEFHEVGAVDAIVDIVGSALGLEALGIDEIYASALPLGSGAVQSAHGILPLPAPATLALIAAVRAPTRAIATDLEVVTPTGAALATALATFGQPSMIIEQVGIGFGTRKLPWPNLMRVWAGRNVLAGPETDEIVEIETNLDDCSPEIAAYAMERLLAAGALDVYFTPIQMKKNRPGVQLSVLARPIDAHALARVVLRETTSLGVRFRTMSRLICQRSAAIAHTRFGALQVKIKSIDGQDIICPEYEACAQAARRHGVPLSEIYAAVLSADRVTPSLED